jgi:hypothetical protein
MLHLHECAKLAPAESAAEPLHSIGDSATVEESVVEPLHSVDDPAAVESAAEPLRFVSNSDATIDAPTETSYSKSCNINESYNIII